MGRLQFPLQVIFGAFILLKVKSMIEAFAYRPVFCPSPSYIDKFKDGCHELEGKGKDYEDCVKYA